MFGLFHVKKSSLSLYLVHLVLFPILILILQVLILVKNILSIPFKIFVPARKTPLVIRTPEERFSKLDQIGYTFKPNYAELPIGGGKTLPRVHYVDEGPRDATETLLCLHGEPSWSFLYRHMIHVFVKAGYRVIAPDYIGSGKSDKYAYTDSYNHDLHIMTLRLLMDHLQLKNVTLVAQDWGGVYGCTLVRDCPDYFSRIIVMNTTVSDGFISKLTPYHIAHATPVMLWQYIVTLTGFYAPIGWFFEQTLLNNPSKEVIEGYVAPFPSSMYQACEAQWSLNLPILPFGALSAELRDVQNFLKKTWKKPVLIMFSDGDVLSVSWITGFYECFPNALKKTIKGAGHFLQEEKGEEVARNIISFVEGKL